MSSSKLEGVQIGLREGVLNKEKCFIFFGLYNLRQILFSNG